MEIDMRGNTKLENYYPLAVLSGGVGHEREISEKSGATFVKILRELAVPTLRVKITPDGDFYILTGGAESAPIREGELIPTFPVRLSGRSGFLTADGIISVGCVIPALHGDFGEDGRIAGLLSCAGIRFVGADTLGGAVTQDKAVAKLIAASEGIPTVPFVLYLAGGKSMPAGACHAYSEDGAVALSEKHLGYPMFVKPSGLGSSVGCASVRNRQELLSAIRAAAALDTRVIIEKQISVRCELEVAYLDGEAQLFAGPCSISADGFYDFDKKYGASGGVRVAPRAEVDEKIIASTHDYARRLVRICEMRSLARVDFLLSRGGELYFNEINAFPGFTDTSMYRELMRRCGVGDRELIERLTGGA